MILSSNLPHFQIYILYIYIIIIIIFLVCLKESIIFINLVRLYEMVVTGERDPMKPRGVKLLESFIDPLVIYHPKGHISTLYFIFSDHKAVNVMQTFIHMISNTSDV